MKDCPWHVVLICGLPMLAGCASTLETRDPVAAARPMDCPSAAYTAVSSDAAGTLATAIDPIFADLVGQGFSGALVVREGPVVLACRAAGDAGPSRAYVPDLPGDVGSIAKPATALAILALSEQGKLTLDDRLDRWFDDVPADKAAITVRQLLLHQSGLSEYVPGTGDYTPISQAGARAAIWTAPLEFAPGEGWAYSNNAYNILAMLVELASGKSYFPAMEDLVFAPAGVEARFDPARFAAVADVPQEGGGWSDLRSTATPVRGPFWTLWGAGGLYMSASGLARFMTAFMDGQIVSPATVAAARVPAVQLDENNAGGLAFGLVRVKGGWVYYFNGMGESGSADVWGDPATGRVMALTANSGKPHAIAGGRKLSVAAFPR